MSTGWVYMMANRPKGRIYIGVTSDLTGRVYEHKNCISPGFTSKYKCFELVWFETHPNIVLAIKREKALKRYSREWKVKLIEGLNPVWNDLSDDVFNIENQYSPHPNTKMYDDYH